VNTYTKYNASRYIIISIGTMADQKNMTDSGVGDAHNIRLKYTQTEKTPVSANRIRLLLLFGLLIST
jgi:hypothetical protein